MKSLAILLLALVAASVALAEEGPKKYRTVYQALADNEVEAGRPLLPYQSDINSRNSEGQTVLCLALETFHQDTYWLVKDVLDLGADVNLICGNDFPPLVVPVISGNAPIVEALVDRGADVNAKAPGDLSAASCAYMQGHHDLAKLLERRGAFIAEHTKIGALRMNAFQNAYMRGLEQMPGNLTAAEEAQYMYDLSLECRRIGLQYETNPYQIQFDTLWIKKASAPRCDPDSGLSEQEWHEGSIDRAMTEAQQESEATGTWSADKLPPPFIGIE